MIPKNLQKSYIKYGPDVERAITDGYKPGDEIVSVSHLYWIIREHPEEYPQLAAMDKRTLKRTLSLNLVYHCNATSLARRRHDKRAYLLPAPVGSVSV